MDGTSFHPGPRCPGDVKAFWGRSGKREQAWSTLPAWVVPEQLQGKSCTFWFSDSAVCNRAIDSSVSSYSEEGQSASSSHLWAVSSQRQGWLSLRAWLHRHKCCLTAPGLSPLLHIRPGSSAALNRAFQTQCFHSQRHLKSQSTPKISSQPLRILPFSLSLADCDLFITSQLFLNPKQTEHWCVIAKICLQNRLVGEENTGGVTKAEKHYLCNSINVSPFFFPSYSILQLPKSAHEVWILSSYACYNHWLNPFSLFFPPSINSWEQVCCLHSGTIAATLGIYKLPPYRFVMLLQCAVNCSVPEGPKMVTRNLGRIKKNAKVRTSK